jgi:hypothetical protein
MIFATQLLKNMLGLHLGEFTDEGNKFFTAELI